QPVVVVQSISPIFWPAGTGALGISLAGPASAAAGRHQPRRAGIRRGEPHRTTPTGENAHASADGRRGM
ncbi:MAG TPA: hypothetical protein VE869_15545, partial [Gemmatimonas sp.]|nr:hypothetical protein [Gemmatimonas sp.]